MKKLTFIATMMFLVNSASADIIKCKFSEPSVNTTYSTGQSTLTYDEDGAVVKVIKNVSLQIKAAGIFELVGADGKVLQTLEINNRGTDGMSDRVYPYEAKLHELDQAVNAGIGGCTSNYLKAQE